MPVNLIVLLMLLAGAAFLLSRTIYITGGNPRSAELVGINAGGVTILCYVICSVMAAIAGLVLVGYVGSVDNWVGRGSVVNSVLGAIILVLTFNFVVIVGLPVQAQLIIKGVVIIVAATLFNRFTNR
ncbi:ABC transporter permease subunit [Paracoccus sp. (in: a-proteobacteria)]|uniref:ABC transporter permease subunit n=1 Tax=Paracoccus sp. TaxID=267 RepID=UPI002AFE4E78|nr:hypothetical protein [Paracoccus sp. (in: a-proteobacteria)]